MQIDADQDPVPEHYEPGMPYSLPVYRDIDKVHDHTEGLQHFNVNCRVAVLFKKVWSFSDAWNIFYRFPYGVFLWSCDSFRLPVKKKR
jgi:hypothetical protein